MKKILLTLLVSGTFAFHNAQVKTPPASPSSMVKQSIGLSEVTVEYSRPSVNKRTIFGDLVPFDKLWRTGANGSTDITFSEKTNFGGVSVPAGKYALYTIPSKDDWTIILYKDTEIWGAPKDLDSNLIIAKAIAKNEESGNFTETFEIRFQDIKHDNANLMLEWENTKVIIPINIDSKEKVMGSIEETLKSKTAKASDFHQAANYYKTMNMDPKEALKFSQKANQMQPDTFYMLKLQSELEAENGMIKEAISTAKKSMELAKKAKNDDYVKINMDNIAKWNRN